MTTIPILLRTPDEGDVLLDAVALTRTLEYHGRTYRLDHLVHGRYVYLPA